MLGFDFGASKGGLLSCGQVVASLDLALVGARGRVLEVLTLLQEAGDADYGEAGQYRKGDREANRQPVGE